MSCNNNLKLFKIPERRYNMWPTFCVNEEPHSILILHWQDKSLALKWGKQNTGMSYFMAQVLVHQDQYFFAGFVWMSAKNISNDTLNKWHKTRFTGGKVLRVLETTGH